MSALVQPISPWIDPAGHTEIIDSIRRRIDALKLDLSGLNVLTEAATGAYACTAVIAAMAGAKRVHAVARDTVRYGSFQDAASATMELACAAGIADRIVIGRDVPRSVLAECDIVTNSGHLRPIGADIIARLPRRSVIGVMYEGWELRPTDIDLEACREHGIAVAAVNERHPDVAVFPFLGPLCTRLLEDAGFDAKGRNIILLCDNPFAPFIESGLLDTGSKVAVCPRIRDIPGGEWDAVVIALDPGKCPELNNEDLGTLRSLAPGALLAQFWGDIEKTARSAWHGSIWPLISPAPGHMAILLNALGPEPIIRLQAGSFRAAQQVFERQALVFDDVAQII